ncbi:hypothetical protein OBBRIDRAFT_808657, partial [Obba rivulosa]
ANDEEWRAKRPSCDGIRASTGTDVWDGIFRASFAHSRSHANAAHEVPSYIVVTSPHSRGHANAEHGVSITIGVPVLAPMRMGALLELWHDSRIRATTRMRRMAYEAIFRMHLVMHGVIPDSIKADSALERKAYAIANVFMSIYLRDVVQAVQSVMAPVIARFKSDPDERLSRRGHSCEEALQSWASLTYPLEMTTAAFRPLLLILTIEDDDPPSALPGPADNVVSTERFVKVLWSMCRPSNPDPIRSPLFRSGYAPRALQCAVKFIIRLASSLSATEHESLILRALLRACSHYRVAFVPWAQRRDGRGRPSHRAQVNEWKMLGRTPAVNDIIPVTGRQVRDPHPDDRMPSATQFTKAHTVSHFNAAWSVQDISLGRLGPYLSRTVPPSDWKPMTNVTERDGIVHRTYKWVVNNINMSDDAHKFAMLAGIVMAKSVPNIFHESDVFDAEYSSLRLKGKSLSSTDRVRHLRWRGLPKTSSGRKGFKSASPFISMVPTAIIALIEDASPLLEQCNQGKPGLDSKWTSKHSNKCIGGVNFVRLGVAVAQGDRALLNPVFRQHYFMLSKEQLAEKYRFIASKWNESPFGPFDALTYMVGREHATFLSENGAQFQRIITLTTAACMGLERVRTKLEPTKIDAARQVRECDVVKADNTDPLAMEGLLYRDMLYEANRELLACGMTQLMCIPGFRDTVLACRLDAGLSHVDSPARERRHEVRGMFDPTQVGKNDSIIVGQTDPAFMPDADLERVEMEQMRLSMIRDAYGEQQWLGGFIRRAKIIRVYATWVIMQKATEVLNKEMRGAMGCTVFILHPSSAMRTLMIKEEDLLRLVSLTATACVGLGRIHDGVVGPGCRCEVNGRAVEGHTEESVRAVTYQAMIREANEILKSAGCEKLMRIPAYSEVIVNARLALGALSIKQSSKVSMSIIDGCSFDPLLVYPQRVTLNEDLDPAFGEPTARTSEDDIDGTRAARVRSYIENSAFAQLRECAKSPFNRDIIARHRGRAIYANAAMPPARNDHDDVVASSSTVSSSALWSDRQRR